MTGENEVTPPDCPDCGTSLDINGIDEQRTPAVVVYSCPSCGANFFKKVKLG